MLRSSSSEVACSSRWPVWEAGAGGRKALRSSWQLVGGLHTVQQWPGKAQPSLPHLPRRPPSSSSECISRKARRPPCTSCGRRHYCPSSCAHPTAASCLRQHRAPQPTGATAPYSNQVWPLGMQQHASSHEGKRVAAEHAAHQLTRRKTRGRRPCSSTPLSHEELVVLLPILHKLHHPLAQPQVVAAVALGSSSSGQEPRSSVQGLAAGWFPVHARIAPLVEPDSCAAGLAKRVGAPVNQSSFMVPIPHLQLVHHGAEEAVAIRLAAGTHRRSSCCQNHGAVDTGRERMRGSRQRGAFALCLHSHQLVHRLLRCHDSHRTACPRFSLPRSA